MAKAFWRNSDFLGFAEWGVVGEEEKRDEA